MTPACTGRTATKGTPRPWRKVVRANQTGVKSVAIAMDARGRSWACRAKVLTKTDVEDADLMIRAVHSHDQLVEALEDALGALAAVLKDDWENVPDTDALLERGRVAIKLAKGET